MLYTDLGTALSSRIWAVSLDGDRKPFPVVEANLAATSGQFSPDGNWIAYQSLESGRGAEIFVQRFPGPGGKSQVSSGGGVQVRWRRDGRELFYLAPDNRLMTVPLSSTQGVTRWRLGTPVSLFAGAPQWRFPRRAEPAGTWSRRMVSVF